MMRAASSVVIVVLLLVAAAAYGAAQSPDKPASGLDFATFRDRVQPLFLNKKAGLARCYVCHSQGTPFRLVRFAEGQKAWTEEDSRKNFAAVQRLVVPGKPDASRLLLMPLAHEAGGNPFGGCAVDVGDHDRRARAAECLCVGHAEPTDAGTAGPRHDRDLAFEQHRLRRGRRPASS